MATTTLGNTSNTMTDRRSLYWGIAIAIVLAIAVILAVQTTSTRDTVVGPETTSGMSNSTTIPVERTDVPPMETAPTNLDVNRAPNGPVGPGPQRNDDSTAPDSANPASP